jgi:hypothetical protein
MGSSVTRTKLPAIWTLGSAVLGSGCWLSCETKAPSTASRAIFDEEMGFTFGCTILVE